MKPSLMMAIVLWTPLLPPFILHVLHSILYSTVHRWSKDLLCFLLLLFDKHLHNSFLDGLEIY